MKTTTIHRKKDLCFPKKALEKCGKTKGRERKATKVFVRDVAV